MTAFVGTVWPLPTPSSQLQKSEHKLTGGYDGRAIRLEDCECKLRDAITKCLEKADPATRKKVEEIGETQPTHDIDDKDVNDNLKLRKQALIDAGMFSGR